VCADSNVQLVYSVNTWEQNDAGGVDVRFCDITSSDGDLANLVSPYVHVDSQEMLPVDTLTESRTDIKRCLDFDICPSSSFTIRGQSVAQRVVLLPDAIRAFSLQDSRLCFAFGLWDAKTELCTVDLLVVPLFEAIYTDSATSISLEAGFKDFEATSWIGLLTTGGTPKPIIERYHRELVKILQSPEIRQKLEDMEFEVIASNPDQFAAWIATEIPRWGKVIKATGAKAD
jgi:hypothetical protein